MSVPHTLLGLLEREPRHGYDLKRDYDTYFGRHKPLPFGQVYATLARLTRDGKVTPGEVESGEGPDRKRYAITNEGKTRTRGLAQRAATAADPISRRMVFTKVALTLMQGRSAEHYLDTQRASHLERRRELNELKRTGTLVDALLADYGLFHVEADLRWMDITEARLSALAEQVVCEHPSRSLAPFSWRFVGRYSVGPGPLAHPEEQGTFNPKVPGSRPGRPTRSEALSASRRTALMLAVSTPMTSGASLPLVA